MRVAILSIWYPTPGMPFVGTFVHEQAKALRKQGVEIRVVNPIPLTPFPLPLLSERYRQLSEIPRRHTVDGFEIEHPRYPSLPNHMLFERVGDWMYAAIRDTMRKLYERWPFDVLHAHTTYPCGLAANRVRDELMPSVKVVHTIHRTCIIDAPNYNPQCMAKVCSALEGADRDIFVSLEGRGLALKYTSGRVEPKCEYITNGVNIDQFELNDADRAEVAALKAKHADTWNLVFVGFLNERKGIKELLEALQQVVANGRTRPIKLFLVGKNELGTQIDEQLTARGLRQHVVLVGPVSHDRVKVWCKFADGFILPSRSEGLPTVLFESLYAATPGIFTRVGGVADIATDGEHALLIPPQSVEHIVTAIERLATDPVLCARLSDQGHRLIRDHYTWDINATRHVELYRQLTGKAA